MITKEQAQLICEANEIFELLNDSEEVEILENQNPSLLEAYKALECLAKS